LELHEDVYREIEGLIGSIVAPYVDPSNPALHFDELMAECNRLARLIHDGKLTRCLTRARFFAFLKTAFKNHVRSLIQKHVYCFKRSGIKPPQKGALNPPLKPIRLSLDDPDATIQVGYWDNQDRPEDLLADFEQTLLEAERLVLHQIVEPNELSMRLAEGSRPEHFRARTALLRISPRHLAVGIGMPHQAFSEIASCIRAKCRKFVRQ
jgi:hypothetical protein